MRGWGSALAHRVAGVAPGRPVAGGSWLGGQPSPPSSQPDAHTAPLNRSEVTMSKRTRALVLAATLAAMNLAGLTAVAHAQANDDPDGKVAGGHPPSATSARPGATARSQHQSRPLPMPPSSGNWPESASPSPTRHPPRCPPPCPTSRPGSPAGCSLPSVSWLLRLPSPVGWPCSPPSEPAAEPGSGTRPDRSHGHAARWGCRAHRQPHRHPSLLSHRPAAPM
jgi:hypothetical protein